MSTCEVFFGFYYSTSSLQQLKKLDCGSAAKKKFETFLGSFLSKGKDEPSKKMKSNLLFYIGRNKKERRKEVLPTI
jgi:hypothetical protein